jgi:segregation and condensation protein B
MNESDMTPLEETSVERPEDGEGFARHLRMLEAILFAASEPLDEATLKDRLPEGADVSRLIADMTAAYANRGVNVVAVAGKWALRTAPDLGFLLQAHATEQRRLSRAAMETLAIVAYHQPVTRAEIEDIRGVSISKGTLDILLELGWIRMRGRRRVPGRPVTYGTSEQFLTHFNLDALTDLPGLEELKAAGLLDGAISGSGLPILPGDALTPTEDPLDPTEGDAESGEVQGFRADAAE